MGNKKETLKNKKEELRSLSIEDLEKKEKDLRRLILEKRLQESGRKGLPVEKPHLYNQHKKDIARIKTIIAEKKK